MRLNKQLRETIIENALKASSIEAETNALSKRSYELSDRVRLDSLGGVEVEINMRTVEKEVARLLERRGIPKQLIANKVFERKTCVYADAPEGSVTFNFSGHIYRTTGEDLPHYKGFTGGAQLVGGRMSYGANHLFVLERNKILNLWSDIISKRENILNNARAVVESVNTVEQLIKIWPEAKALIPTEKVSAPMPLSTNVASLNDLIGLPK